MDIKAFFDEVIDHELLMKALDKHVPEKWVKMYIRRWLQTPVQTAEGLVQKHGQGTPNNIYVSRNKPVASQFILALCAR